MRHQIAFNALSQQIDDPNTYLHDLRVSCEAFDQANEWLERAEAGDAAVAAEIPEEHWESIRDNAQISQEGVQVHVNSGQVQAVIDWLKKYIPILLRKIKEIFMNFFAWIGRVFGDLERRAAHATELVRSYNGYRFTFEVSSETSSEEKLDYLALKNNRVFLDKGLFKDITNNKPSSLEDSLELLLMEVRAWFTSLGWGRDVVSAFEPISGENTASDVLHYLNTGELPTPRSIVTTVRNEMVASVERPEFFQMEKTTALTVLGQVVIFSRFLKSVGDIFKTTLIERKRSLNSFQVNNGDILSNKAMVKIINYETDLFSSGMSWRLKRLNGIVYLIQMATKEQ